MKLLDRSVIEEFSDVSDNTAYDIAYAKINGVIHDALKVIKQRNPYIKNYKIFVANEAFSDTVCYASSLDLFILFDAVQIELNNNRKVKNKFLNSIKMFWREFKNNFKLFGSKKKHNEKQIKKTEKQALVLDKYDVNMLYNDLIVQMLKIVYNKTQIGVNKNKVITIVGEEEFGIEINIIPIFANKEKEGTYKLYDLRSKNYIVIDFKDRIYNIESKNERTLEGFSTQVKIFNNLFWNVTKQKPNQIFIESLLYDCPDELFLINDVDTTFNLVNYIKNSTMQTKKSICDNKTPLFKELLNTTTYETALKFVNKIDIEN